MATRDAVGALQEASELLPSDDDGLANDIREELDELQSRARAVALLEDLRERPDVDDVHLGGVQEGGSLVDVTFELATDVEPDRAQETTEPDVDEPADVATDDDVDIDQDEEDDGPHWCGRCGQQADTENGIKIHNGHNHTAPEAIVLDEEPSEDDLVGDPEAEDDNADGQADSVDVEETEEATDGAGDDDESDVSWTSDGAEEDDDPTEPEASDEDDDETALADEDADHKYEAGDKLSADTSDEPPEEVPSDALDDLDSSLPDPADVLEVAKRDDVETIQGMADELGIADTAIARVISHRLELYDTVLPRPEGEPTPATTEGDD